MQHWICNLKKCIIKIVQKPFLPDNCNTCNMNNNPKNNILMSENINVYQFTNYQ